MAQAASAMEAASSGISLIGVAKSFGGVAAVRDCTAEIPFGCITGIVGPNGAGKSTVFNLICGFVAPDAGRIVYRGENIAGLSPPQVFRRGIARSFQGVRTLRNLSVLENLLLGATAAKALSRVWLPFVTRKADEAAVPKAWQLLDELGLTEAANRLAGSLSYAEQKLLAIGRLMMADVDMVLLDEPLGGLDPNGIDGFIARIHSLVERGRTVCVVEHNLNAVRRMTDRVIFMADGTVQASGTTGEVLAREDLARLYLGVTAAKGSHP
ncbi:MAG: metal-dependent hydrolase [Alphaproteobacteria bacterium]|jgi:ABC-type branched-subunit amino acid transport system ATPase component|nr:metal-dependent hydrolase [Alphaproteobacteria bacterium]